MSDKLRELIAKWRGIYEGTSRGSLREDTQLEAYRYCAKDLEALLTEPQPEYFVAGNENSGVVGPILQQPAPPSLSAEQVEYAAACSLVQEPEKVPVVSYAKMADRLNVLLGAVKPIELLCPICKKPLSSGISWCKTCDVTHAVSCVECYLCGYINEGPCELGRETEIRDRVLEEAFNLIPASKIVDRNSAQFSEGFYSGLEAYRQAIRAALKSQVSVTGASHDK